MEPAAERRDDGYGYPGACSGVLPGAEDSDVGGVHDADEEPGNPGVLIVVVPGLVGEVPG
jgi:hypothetical protein